MSEAKFTKGEWIVYKESDGYGKQSWDQIVIGMDTYNQDPNKYYCAHKVVIDDEDTNQEAMANAYLIKTSPKMYTALDLINQLLYNIDKDTLDWLEAHTGSISELLAEARGEYV